MPNGERFDPGVERQAPYPDRLRQFLEQAQIHHRELSAEAFAGEASGIVLPASAKHRIAEVQRLLKETFVDDESRSRASQAVEGVKRLIHEGAKEAYLDPLTGMLNQGGFDRLLNDYLEYLAVASNYEAREFQRKAEGVFLIRLDLSGGRLANSDSLHGWDTGDAYFESVGKIIEYIAQGRTEEINAQSLGLEHRNQEDLEIRSIDQERLARITWGEGSRTQAVSARLRGDEFFVLLSGANEEQAREMERLIRDQMMQVAIKAAPGKKDFGLAVKTTHTSLAQSLARPQESRQEYIDLETRGVDFRSLRRQIVYDFLGDSEKPPPEVVQIEDSDLDQEQDAWIRHKKVAYAERRLLQEIFDEMIEGVREHEAREVAPNEEELIIGRAGEIIEGLEDIPDLARVGRVGRRLGWRRLVFKDQLAELNQELISLEKLGAGADAGPAIQRTVELFTFLQEECLTDPLLRERLGVPVYNKTALHKILEAKFLDCVEGRKPPEYLRRVGFFQIRIDYLKYYNDVAGGHQGGDEILIRSGIAIEEILREVLGSPEKGKEWYLCRKANEFGIVIDDERWQDPEQRARIREELEAQILERLAQIPMLSQGEGHAFDLNAEAVFGVSTLDEVVGFANADWDSEEPVAISREVSLGEESAPGEEEPGEQRTYEEYWRTVLRSLYDLARFKKGGLEDQAEAKLDLQIDELLRAYNALVEVGDYLWLESERIEKLYGEDELDLEGYQRLLKELDEEKASLLTQVLSFSSRYLNSENISPRRLLSLLNQRKKGITPEQQVRLDSEAYLEERGRGRDS